MSWSAWCVKRNLSLHVTSNVLIYSLIYLLIYLLTYSMEQSHFWEAKLFAASPHFMESEGSLPKSQVPATCPYREPTRSVPYPQTPLTEDPFSHFLIIYAWVSQLVSFLQASPPKSCISFSHPPYPLHSPPISFFSILSPKQYWVRYRDRKAPHYIVFSLPSPVT